MNVGKKRAYTLKLELGKEIYRNINAI